MIFSYQALETFLFPSVSAIHLIAKFARIYDRCPEALNPIVEAINTKLASLPAIDIQRTTQVEDLSTDLGAQIFNCCLVSFKISLCCRI
jgi:hypothetical protein